MKNAFHPRLVAAGLLLASGLVASCGSAPRAEESVLPAGGGESIAFWPSASPESGPPDQPGGTAARGDGANYDANHDTAGAEGPTSPTPAPGGDEPRAGEAVTNEPPSDGAGSPPPSPGVLVSPGSVTEGEQVDCVVSPSVDPDGGPVTLAYAWHVNGQPVAGQSGASLTSAHFDKGDEVQCVVVASNAAASTEPVLSKNNATVKNSPPSLQAAVLSPASVAIDGAFQCAWSGWHDPDPADVEGVSITWERVSGGAPTTLQGQTTAGLLASAVGVGASVRCVVVPHDGTVGGAPVTSGLGQVVASAASCAAVAQQLDLAVKSVPPSVLLVVDRSGSMLEAWSETKAAVGEVLGGLPGAARTGLLMFPAQKGCTVPSAPQVPLAEANSGNVVAAMDAAGVGGSTPMGQALRSAREYLEGAATSNTVVVLAADGKPSDTCLADCTGCNCTDEATCLWCADLIECTEAEVRKEVEKLESLGVRTFVVGYKGGFGATEFLNSLAVAGGTDSAGPTPFYDAGDGSALGSVLESIADGLDLCTAAVTVPGSYASVNVTVGGTPVPADPSGQNGHTLDPLSGILRLHGAACDAAVAAGGVNVVFGCE